MPHFPFRYKAHLLRKTWDRLAQARMFARANGKEDVVCIMDYGQKHEPQGQIESQTECFGKAGISQFGATFLMPASAFTRAQLVEQLGEERANAIKPGDMIVFTCVLYNADANQDWVHSVISLQGCIVLLLERFPHVKTLRLRSDGAGNFKNSSFAVSLIELSQSTGVDILEMSVSEAGGGKDLTDSLIMQQKQRLREGVLKPGGSTRNAWECVTTVQEGEEEVGATGSCATREMVSNRPSSGVNGAKKGALPGISTLYHLEYEYQDRVFVGLRVFCHEGIGPGKFFTAEQCKEMWLEDGGLSEDLFGEMRQATSKLDEGHAARERAAGSGSRLLRGEEHKQLDLAATRDKKAKTDAGKAEKERRGKDEMAAAVAASGVRCCTLCGKPFTRLAYLAEHEKVCALQQAAKESNRLTAVLRPAADISRDKVHTAASFNVGEGIVSRGEENRELFFPKPIHTFPLPTNVPVVKEGWAPKGVAGAKKGGAFEKSQKEFLLMTFNNEGYKVRERDALKRMQERFTDNDPNSPYSARLVLSEAQIKSWFSSEAARRKKLALIRVFDKGLTELGAAMDLEKGSGDLPEENEGGADGNGVGEGVEGDGMSNLSVRVPAADGGGEPVEGDELLHTTFYLAGKELWEEKKAFEVWQMDVANGPDVLPDDLLLTSVLARKWVHEASLLQPGQAKADPIDLPDKTPGGGKLGLKGERRFAPRVGRAGLMKQIEPGLCPLFVTVCARCALTLRLKHGCFAALYGDVWVKIALEREDLRMHVDQKGLSRISFIFKQEGAVVERAYDLLS